MSLMLPIGMIVIFYFLLIRPQNQRMKKHRAMIAAIKKGDTVITQGGFSGREVMAEFRRATGLPSLAELLQQAAAMGVPAMACESGLHLCGLGPALILPGVETGGLVAFLADARNDELMFA